MTPGEPEVKAPPLHNKRSHWLKWTGLVLVLAVAVAFVLLFARSEKKQAPASVVAAPAAEPGVACLGRLEPEDGVIRVAAPYFAGRPSLVRELRVKEGDTVRAGQILAVLDGFRSMEAGLRQSEARLAVALNRLNQVKSGEKAGEIAAQEADVKRKQSELEHAEAEFRRYEKLYQARDISASQLDEKRTALERARLTRSWAQEKLKSLSEVRQVDIELARSEVEAARAQVRQAEAELASTVVHSPVDAQVLKILVRPGEQADQAILEVGKTQRMFVAAEVYETDVGRVRRGQQATITSDLFSGSLQGTVTEVGTKVSRREVLPLDPAAFADARVVQVKIRLEESNRVAGLIYGKVNVRIHP